MNTGAGQAKVVESIDAVSLSDGIDVREPEEIIGKFEGKV